MKAPRWIAVSPSAFEWEREALDFLRGNLPDHEPWRAWSNCEFIDDEGRVNEVARTHANARRPGPEVVPPITTMFALHHSDQTTTDHIASEAIASTKVPSGQLSGRTVCHTISHANLNRSPLVAVQSCTRRRPSAR